MAPNNLLTDNLLSLFVLTYPLRKKYLYWSNKYLSIYINDLIIYLAMDKCLIIIMQQTLEESHGLTSNQPL